MGRRWRRGVLVPFVGLALLVGGCGAQSTPSPAHPTSSRGLVLLRTSQSATLAYKHLVVTTLANEDPPRERRGAGMLYVEPGHDGKPRVDRGDDDQEVRFLPVDARDAVALYFPTPEGAIAPSPATRHWSVPRIDGAFLGAPITLDEAVGLTRRDEPILHVWFSRRGTLKTGSAEDPRPLVVTESGEGVFDLDAHCYNEVEMTFRAEQRSDDGSVTEPQVVQRVSLVYDAQRSTVRVNEVRAVRRAEADGAASFDAWRAEHTVQSEMATIERQL